MPKLDVAALQKFAEDVEEAHRLLAQKATLEGEIAAAEKFLRRRQLEVDAAAQRLMDIQAKAAAEEAKFSHEKARYKIDLDEHVKSCQAKKQAAESDAAAGIVAASSDVRTRVDQAQAESRKLTADIAILLARRNQLVAELQDFKRRIHALPE